MRKLFYFIGLLCLFFSCKNEQPKDKFPENPPQKIENPPPANTLPKHYLHLKGTIKDLPVTMNLNYNTPQQAGDSIRGFYSGSYYYDKYQEPIEVWQSNDSANVLILTEKYAYDEENRFVGQFSDNSFIGQWHDGYRQFSFPFQLQIVEEGVVPFDFFTYSDNFVLNPQTTDSPLASYGLSVLWPKDAKETATTNFIKREIMNMIVTDTAALNARTPADYFEMSKANYFKNYQKDMAEMGDNPLNYGRDMDISVIWNAEDYLSLGAMYYEYAGGAHGNYGTIYKVLDLKNLKVLTEKDIFKPGFETAIAKSLLKSAQRTFDSDMNDYTPIDAISKEDLKPNGNFFLTGGGIGYNFVPYEIAPYALGEIKLFLPKNEIKKYLQPSFIQQMNW